MYPRVSVQSVPNWKHWSFYSRSFLSQICPCVCRLNSISIVFLPDETRTTTTCTNWIQTGLPNLSAVRKDIKPDENVCWLTRSVFTPPARANKDDCGVRVRECALLMLPATLSIHELGRVQAKLITILLDVITRQNNSGFTFVLPEIIELLY